jgi:hypothetical protein
MDGFVELKALPPSAAKAGVNWRTAARSKKTDELIGILSLRAETCEAAGWKKPPARVKISEGQGEHRGKLLIMPDPNGPFIVRDLAKGGITIRCSVPNCLRDEESARLPCAHELAGGGVVVSLPKLLILKEG